jgi:hypothetical protein
LVLATVAVALLLLTVLDSLRTASLLDGFLEAARTLFFFADIVFYVWVPFLVIAHLRLRRAPRPWPTFLGALAGGVVNVLVVLLIGFVQEGGVADFVALAVEGSLAVVVAAAAVTRVLPAAPVKPPSSVGARP